MRVDLFKDELESLPSYKSAPAPAPVTPIIFLLIIRQEVFRMLSLFMEFLDIIILLLFDKFENDLR